MITILLIILIPCIFAVVISNYIEIDLIKIKLCITYLNDESINLETIENIRDSILFKNVNPIKNLLEVLNNLIEEEKLLTQLNKSIKELKVDEANKLINKIESIQKNFK